MDGRRIAAWTWSTRCSERCSSPKSSSLSLGSSISTSAPRSTRASPRRRSCTSASSRSLSRAASHLPRGRAERDDEEGMNGSDPSGPGCPDRHGGGDRDPGDCRRDPPVLGSTAALGKGRGHRGRYILGQPPARGVRQEHQAVLLRARVNMPRHPVVSPRGAEGVRPLLRSRSICLSSVRRILPLIVLGRSGTNSISRGYLYGAVTVFTCSCSSPTSASEGA